VAASSRALGRGCAAAVIATANSDATTKALDVQLGALLGNVPTAVDKALAEGRSGLKAANAVHVRRCCAAIEQSNSTVLPCSLQWHRGARMKNLFQQARLFLFKG
jgi:transposase